MSAHTSPVPSTATNAATTQRKAINLPKLREMKANGEKITLLTAYDATFARAADDAGLDCLLIGDSLGMVLQGHSSTVPVTLQDMVYHTRCVAVAAKTAWIVGDLPYGSYHEGVEQAYRNACALMQAGAHMVKLEGGGWTAPVVEYLTTRAIPVCAHLGLTPQSVHALGGYRIQGKDEVSAQKLKNDALALESAGAAMCVLELIPSSVAHAVTLACKHMATIGIGAGVGTDGQVLVLHDMLGLGHGRVPRFVKNFLDGAGSIQQALANYVLQVKAGVFPDEALHTY